MPRAVILAAVVLTLCAPPAFARAAAPKPEATLAPLDHDHDPDSFEDNSKDPDLLLRLYGHNSHLQKLLDLGLYQLVFDDDTSGEEAFLAAGAHIEGLTAFPLTPMAFATWRNETRTISVLAAHGAKPASQPTDQDQLVRNTVDTVMGVADMAKHEMILADAEYKRTHAKRH